MVAAVSLVILLYCVMNGTTILNIFNPEVSVMSVCAPASRDEVATDHFICVSRTQGEGVMMSYAENKAKKAELNEVVTGGAISRDETPENQ